ncbi:MAG: hypothetical protein JNJ77_11395 [Planctomycetia bacterium]|nr:hypothetical protein [Planctomycetia bacterium]
MINVPRRQLLQLVMGSLAAGLAVQACSAYSSMEVLLEGKPEGKPGDFEFLTGEWKIKNRRLKTPGGKEWDEFDGEATCWSILMGVCSIEELRIPARHFAGMGLRLLDVQKKVWNDYWVNAKSGVLTTPGLTGNFEKGVGTFSAEEMENGKKVISKGVWDRITPSSCRWYQAGSNDGGKTWKESWFMDWTRVK